MTSTSRTDFASPRTPPPTPLELESVLNSLETGIVIADETAGVRFCNTRAMQWVGARLDLPTLFAKGRFLGPFAGWAAVLRRVVEERQEVRLEWSPISLESDAPTSLTVRCRPLAADHASPGGVVLLLDDSSETRNPGEPQDLSRRLASLGKLAARVAHELNNPLDGILRYINLAIRVSGDAPESKLKAYLSESRTGLMRMVQIIGDLLEYSRSTAGEFDDVTIPEVIEQAVRTLASTADERKIVIAVDSQSRQMPTVRGNRLYQVLCNLIRNAIHAMPDGGRLTITSGIVDEYAVIRVEDTGSGLTHPPEKLFEPFFTTKPPGEGTGLGLAICKDFVEEMGGTISGENAPGGGAVFTVRIPVETRGPRNPSPRKVDP